MKKSASKKSSRSPRPRKAHEPARDEFGLLWCKEEFPELTRRFEADDFAEFTLWQRVGFLGGESLQWRGAAHKIARILGRDDVETVFAELAGGSGGDEAQGKIDAAMDSSDEWDRELCKNDET